MQNVNGILHSKAEGVVWMKKTDEMDQRMFLRSEEWGYRVLLLALSAWTLYNCLQAALNGRGYEPVPGWVLLGGVLAQGLSRLAIRQRMLAGDEEYHEPNRLLRVLLEAVAVVVALIAAGMHLVSRA